MSEFPSSKPDPGRRPSRAKRIIWPALGLVAVGALAVATMGPGSGMESANGPASMAAASSSPAPIPEAQQEPLSTANPLPVTEPSPAAAPPTGGTDLPPSAIDNPALKEPVKSAVAGFITKTGQISTESIPSPAPDDPAPPPAAIDFTAVAYGSALGELEAQSQEFASNGWQQTGTVEVAGTASTTTSSKDGADLVSVTVCLDSSAVSVADNTGATVLAAEETGTRKNLNTYVVQEVSGVWLVVEHIFPGDSGC